MHGYVYIITNKHNTVLYTGATNNIELRTLLHRIKFYPYSFSARYNLGKLVYFMTFEDIKDAFARETQIKAGKRKTKIELIESINPNWDDLYEQVRNKHLEKMFE